MISHTRAAGNTAYVHKLRDGLREALYCCISRMKGRQVTYGRVDWVRRKYSRLRFRRKDASYNYGLAVGRKRVLFSKNMKISPSLARNSVFWNTRYIILQEALLSKREQATHFQLKSCQYVNSCTKKNVENEWPWRHLKDIRRSVGEIHTYFKT